MYSSACKGIALLVFILMNNPVFSVTAKEQSNGPPTTPAFSVHPQQCVTLRQGRECFATITIQWQNELALPLCLYQLNPNKADSQKQLICWPIASKGQTKIEFESSDNLTYQLRTLKDQRLIAQKEVVVSWVHKNTTRKRRWRLF